MNDDTGAAAPPPLRTEPPAAGSPPPYGPPFGPAPGSLRGPLRRSGTDRVAGGVAGGLGRYFGIDPVIFRVVFAVLAIFGGSGLLIYAILWAVLPEEGRDASAAESFVRDHGRPTSIVLGVLLALVALPLFGAVLFGGWWGLGRTDFGAVLIVFALALVIIYVRRPEKFRRFVPQGAYTPVEYGAAAPPGPAAGAATEPTTPYVSQPTTPYATAYTPPPVPPKTATWTAPPPPRKPRERSGLGLLTLGLAAVVGGILIAIDMSPRVDVPTVLILATMLGVIGLGLLVGAFVGRARWLIAIAVPLTIATAAVAAVPHNLGHGVDARWTPTSVAGIKGAQYKLTSGDAVLDLRQLDRSTLSSTPDEFQRFPNFVSADVNFGTLTVIVPNDLPVQLLAHVGVGDVTWPPGHSRSGFGVDVSDPIGDLSSTPYVTVAANVNVGKVEVRHEAA
jgi:phage shock protein PspC (stress-responsive transcriptional regulator)